MLIMWYEYCDQDISRVLWKPRKGYSAQPEMSEVSWRRLCISCFEGQVVINQLERRGQALLEMIPRFGLA